MNNSLLCILNRENIIMNSISTCEYKIAVFSDVLDHTNSSTYECLVENEKVHMANLYQQLTEVRSEMRDYFMQLFLEKGDKRNG